MNKFSKIFHILFFCLPILTNAQFLEDEKAKESTLKGLDLIYNFEFEKAEQILSPVKNQYANHPVVHLLNALQIQNQFVPIDANPTAYKSYINELKKCEERAKVFYKNPKFKTEATYFMLAAEGLLALSNVYRKEYLEMGVIAKRAYGVFLESQRIKNQSAEFLFSSGLYNYYRVQYPESHPITNSIFYFFDKGNKKLGIQELEQSAKNSVFSRIEAQTFLIHILIKYESNFKKAHIYANNLYTKYPNNSLFLISQIESLLYIKEYEKAASLNVLLSKKTDAVSKICNLTFEGYLDEHFRSDAASAKANYAKAIKIPRDDRHTKDYHAMAYLGLGTILRTEKNDAKAKAMFKESLKIAEYSWIIDKAKTELKTLK
jgi:hypothetical protein